MRRKTALKPFLLPRQPRQVQPFPLLHQWRCGHKMPAPFCEFFPTPKSPTPAPRLGPYRENISNTVDRRAPRVTRNRRKTKCNTNDTYQNGRQRPGTALPRNDGLARLRHNRRISRVSTGIFCSKTKSSKPRNSTLRLNFLQPRGAIGYPSRLSYRESIRFVKQKTRFRMA